MKVITSLWSTHSLFITTIPDLIYPSSTSNILTSPSPTKKIISPPTFRGEKAITCQISHFPNIRYTTLPLWSSSSFRADPLLCFVSFLHLHRNSIPSTTPFLFYVFDIIPSIESFLLIFTYFQFVWLEKLKPAIKLSLFSIPSLQFLKKKICLFSFYFLSIIAHSTHSNLSHPYLTLSYQLYYY